MKIYVASPLFSDAEKQFNKQLANKLKHVGHNVFLPQEDNKNNHVPKANLTPTIEKNIYLEDMKHLINSDIVVAVLDGQDIDSGTSFEIGYAKCLKKPIIGICTTEKDRNLMITCSIDDRFTSIEDLLEFLEKDI